MYILELMVYNVYDNHIYGVKASIMYVYIIVIIVYIKRQSINSIVIVLY